MMDINMRIARNILAQLEMQHKKQIDLAGGIGTTKQVVSKMLNGSRMINAIELHKIATYLNISMDDLLSKQNEEKDTNVIRAFMGKVTSPEAKEAIATADTVADLILYHAKVMENTKNMMTPWEE